MIADAQMRGASVREKLRNAEGGSWSPDEAAVYLGISKAAVLKRYKKGAARCLARGKARLRSHPGVAIRGSPRLARFGGSSERPSAEAIG